MHARVFHNHTGQAEQIDKDLKAQLDGQPVKIGHKYVFTLPTNGAKLIVVLNSRGFYHMYVPVAVYLGRECLGYAFAEHAERAKDGAMVQKGWNASFCESLEDENVHPLLRDLYNENTEKGIHLRVRVESH